MAHKKHWNGLEDLELSSEQQEAVDNEFDEDLSVLNMNEGLLTKPTPRRDFLKYVGFSTLAATVAASCEMPVRKAIPFAIKPENILPGVPYYYASSFVDNGDYCSVVVKTRDGRPIMVEGNDKSSITKGGSSPRSLASTLSLYDKTRLRSPYVNGSSVDTFNKVDQPIKEALANAQGDIYIITGTVMSPTTQQVIDRFLSKYPNAKHVQYDPVSYSGMLLANEESFNKKALPSYHFDKAQTIFSIGADFLGTWLSPVEFSSGYASNRKVTIKNPTMSNHYQVEGMLSMTGANADNRATCRPSEYGKVAAALYNAIVSGTKPSFDSDNLNNVITNAASDLKKGNGLVVSGSNDKATQVIVNAINDAIGAYGNTINWGVESNYKKGDDADFRTFVQAAKAGNVGVALFHGVNPVYDYTVEDLTEVIGKIKTTISFNDRFDETTSLASYVVPDHHWLEKWGDAEPKTGYYSFMQPTIAPLFKTRAFEDSLLTWAEDTQEYHDIWNAYWVQKIGSQTKFDEALQEGVFEPSEMNIAGASFQGDVAAAIQAVQPKSNSEYEVIVYQKISIGYGGTWSNNPWLQEMPDPITKATWDNYICMSPNTAKHKFNAELNGLNQVDANKRVLKVTIANGHSIELPVVVIPGMHDQVIAIATGFGRTEKVGMASANRGKNAFELVDYKGETLSYYNDVTIEETNNFYPIAITQTHMSYEDRPIVREYTLEEFKTNPRALDDSRKEELGAYTSLQWEKNENDDPDAFFDLDGFKEHGTMYPVHEKHGIHWGMSIDLNTCTGCGACTVACQAENNVSVVGKDEVLLNHEMAWIRVDRYFSGNPEDADSIQAVFQPMMCQHCDNAPCENVCPVSATNHSQEGLNQMIYNRCIGTKYCANNCPYKVRRFNWFDYNGADAFADNLYKDGVRDDINDDLTRMVLNPDVTVRSRGVMEKCTFCVQRLQESKLAAKQAGEPLQDGAAKTACQTACPTHAITFGNANDKNSAIHKLRKEEYRERIYYVLEHLHVLPNVNYLSKIRNTNSIVAGTEEDGLYHQHI